MKWNVNIKDLEVAQYEQNSQAPVLVNLDRDQCLVLSLTPRKADESKGPMLSVPVVSMANSF